MRYQVFEWAAQGFGLIDWNTITNPTVTIAVTASRIMRKPQSIRHPISAELYSGLLANTIIMAKSPRTNTILYVKCSSISVTSIITVPLCPYYIDFTLVN
jgi:hypothetical protein